MEKQYEKGIVMVSKLPWGAERFALDCFFVSHKPEVPANERNVKKIPAVPEVEAFDPVFKKISHMHH